MLIDPSAKFRVGQSPDLNQVQSEIVSLDNGNIAFFWTKFNDPHQSVNPEIIGRLFDSNENPVSNEVHIGKSPNGSVGWSAAAVLKDGNIAVTWLKIRRVGNQTTADIVTRVFNEKLEPISKEGTVNKESKSQLFWPRIASLNDGGFVVSWLSRNRIPSLCARVFDGSGKPTSKEAVVDEDFKRTIYDSDITHLDQNRVLFTWSMNGPEGRSIKGQVFNRRMIPVSTQFYVETGSKIATKPVACRLKNERFCIAWRSLEEKIKCQVFDMNNKPVSLPIHVEVAKFQGDLAIASTQDGHFIVAWDNNVGPTGYSLSARKFSYDGLPHSDVVLLSEVDTGQILHPAATSIGQDRFMLSWQEADTQEQNPTIFGLTV